MDTPLKLTNKKRVPWICSVEQKGTMDCSSPSTLMQSLLGETTINEFFASFWEKEALIVKRNDTNFYGSLFTHAVMKEILQTNEFEFHADVSVCHETDFTSELGRVTVERAEKLINGDKATLHFYHPQRYVDELWKIIGQLETYFGSLVGSNAFVCPPGTKELPPHCEDVETFVLIIEGEVEWKLYKPMVELSRDFTHDLMKGTVGEPTVTVLLQPGDLLYFPRGTIYQCRTMGEGNATYIAASTYLQNTWGDFVFHAVSRAIENALENDVAIRSGLPINYLSFLGTGKNMSKYVEYSEDDDKKKKASMYQSNLDKPEVVEFKENVQTYLAKLIEHIDVNRAADAMSQYFILSRLPPYGHIFVSPSDPDDADENTAPTSENVPTTDDAEENEKKSPKKKFTYTTNQKLVTINDHVKIKYPEHIRLVYNDEEGDIDDSDIDSDFEDMDDECGDEVVEENANSAKKKSKSLSKKYKKSTTSEGDDDDDDEAIVDNTEPCIKICHSLHNDRFSHMGFNIYDEVEGVKFDVSYTKAVVELINSTDFVIVKDLLMDKDDEKLLLANKLAHDGLLEIKSWLI